MQIFIASAENALGSYDIDAVGTTEAEAIAVCRRAVRKARREAGYPPYAYMDDIQAVPMTVGKAHLDMGKAGEL